MPAVINPIITDAGLAAAIAASGSGLQLAITHVALGSGQYTPAFTQTAMSNRREKVAIAGGQVGSTGSFLLSVIFPSWVDAPYNACEVGFYAGDPDAGGILFAVYSAPAGLIVSRTNIDYVASFALQLTRVPAGSVTVTVDVSLSLALAALDNHVGEVNPHSQYVRHDAPQGLSNPAKDQGRRNLNAQPGGNHTLVVASRALTVDNAGLVSVDASAGNITITLPVASAMVAMPLKFVRLDDDYSKTVTVSRAGTDALRLGGSSPTSFTVEPSGGFRELMSNGSNAWLSVSSSDDGLAVGDLVFVAGSAPRPGTIKGNGTLVSRLLYPRLFRKAMADGLVSEAEWVNGQHGRYSAGDGATTFRVPDYRGEFIRCLDDGKGVDPGRTHGSHQSDAMQGHLHPSWPNAMQASATNTSSETGGVQFTGTISGQPTGTPVNDGFHGVPRIASETRPRSIALLACIKY